MPIYVDACKTPLVLEYSGKPARTPRQFISVAASKRSAMAAPTTVAATAIIAAKRELCSPLSSSATATAARTDIAATSPRATISAA